MARNPKPFTIIRRSDSKTYRLTLNPFCGLSERVCREWFCRSFQHLPAELANHRNPKTKAATEATAFAKLPGDVLREFLGHRSIGMTDHYDNPILLERLLAFQDMRSKVEQFRGKAEEKKILEFKAS